jgi:hypothetical protein
MDGKTLPKSWGLSAAYKEDWGLVERRWAQKTFKMGKNPVR